MAGIGEREQQVIGVEIRAAHVGGPARGRVHQFPGLLAGELEMSTRWRGWRAPPR
jgi:hypothetical protein